MYRIGIDFGGTKIEGIILDSSMQECYRIREATNQSGGYLEVLQGIERVYGVLASEIDYAPHTLGVGTPGSLSPIEGALRFCNITFMNGKSIKLDLEKRLQRNLAIENDANCFILAEHTLGAAKEAPSAFGLVLGTGCGGGYVVDGKLIIGRNGISGEWGHSVLDPNGPDCYCGRKGCVERYLSGSALQSLYKEISGVNTTVQNIVEKYQKGEKYASFIIKSFFESFGIAVANLISTIDPDVIVVGGGLSNIQGIYLDGLENVCKNLISKEVSPKIVENSLGDSSGVLGAALIGV